MTTTRPRSDSRSATWLRRAATAAPAATAAAPSAKETIRGERPMPLAYPPWGAATGLARGDHPAQHRRDLAQETVARGVAEAVVHHLEAVQGEERHDVVAALVARALHRVREPLEERAPVRQAGQWVVVGLEREPQREPV